MRHVSIDIETLGTAVDSYILSVGAVAFDIETGELGEEFIGCADMITPQYKRTVYSDTVKWWLEQSSEAVESSINGSEFLLSILNRLRNLIHEDTYVWGNGAAFDISILEHAYNNLNSRPIPWNFWNVRDMRTIVAIAEHVAKFNKKSVVRQGTHHSALDDAKHQAVVIHKAYKALRKYRAKYSANNE